MMNKKIILTLFACSFALSVAFLSFTFVRETRRVKQVQLPRYGQVQPFTLTDEQGQVFGLEDLKGEVWVADFFFSTCGDICPIMGKHMAALSRSFEQIPEVEFVSITVNPEYDTAQVLKNYAERFKFNQEQWHFLTGSREEIRDIVLNSFKLGSIEEPIFHSPKFTLVDGNGIIRGYYDGTDQESVNELFLDINILLKEK